MHHLLHPWALVLTGLGRIMHGSSKFSPLLLLNLQKTVLTVSSVSEERKVYPCLQSCLQRTALQLYSSSDPSNVCCEAQYFADLITLSCITSPARTYAMIQSFWNSASMGLVSIAIIMDFIILWRTARLGDKCRIWWWTILKYSVNYFVKGIDIKHHSAAYISWFLVQSCPETFLQ